MPPLLEAIPSRRVAADRRTGTVHRSFLRLGPLFAPTVDVPAWCLAAAAAILLLICAATGLVYGTGGTQYAWPYLILMPVVLSAAIFKLLGGLLAAVVAALALGPWMPLDVAAGVMQSTQNWLVRLAMFLAIGGIAGVAVTLLDLQHRRMLNRARRDARTGLLSDTAILQQLGKPTPVRHRTTHVLAISLESHGRVASAMGEDVGDRLIAHVGMVVGDILGREAAVGRLEPGVLGAALLGSHAEATAMVQHIRSRLQGSVEVDGVLLPVVTRLGAAPVTSDDRQDGRPFRKAQLALRTAREHGRDLVWYSAAQDRRATDILALLGDFERDLAEGRFQLHLQPKLDLATGRVVGAEALCRWNNRSRGNVPPDLFVPLVEQTALVDAFSRHVAEQAATILARWEREGLNLALAINLSAGNLRDTKFIGFLRRLPARHGLPPGRLELEVTESGMVADFRWTSRALRLLRASGFPVAMDDFGTGFATLSYLKDLPADWVKLDKSFVQGLPEDPRCAAIAAATATLCKRLEFRCIAEGVENAAAQQALLELGFDAIQGYHLARPMPPDEFEAWLRQHRESRMREDAAAD